MALLAVLLAGGCASSPEPTPPAAVEGESSVAPGVTCVPPSPLPAVPTAVQLPPGAVLTDETEQAGQRLVTGRVEATVEQVLEHFRNAPGYVVTRDEDEGRAGELLLFGAAGDVGVTVGRLTCPRGATGFTIATAGNAGTQPSPSR